MPPKKKPGNSEIDNLKARVEESELRFQSIFDTVIDGVISIDEYGIIENVNPVALSMFGYSRDELIGRNVSILTGAKHADKHDGYIQKYISTGSTHVIGQRRELRARRSSGQEFPIELSVSEMWVAGKRRFTGIVRDISNRIAAEDMAQQAEKNLVYAIDALPDGFALYDLDDRLVLFNSRYKDIYGKSAKYIAPGISFEDLLREGLKRGQYNEAIGREEEWLKQRLEHHRNPSDDAVEQLLDDGTWVRIIERKTAQGFTVGFRIDITELKEKEIALKISEERTRKTIDSSSDAVIIIDVTGHILDFNPAAEANFGYRKEKILGKEMVDLLVPHRYREMHAAGMRRYSETGSSEIIGRRVEVPGLRADGSEFLMELSIHVAESSDSPIFIGFARDISERKAAENALIDAKEKAEEANSAQTNFVAMMSHEIRTPLNGVMGILGILKDSELNDKQHELVDTGVESGQSLLRIINDILDYSKIEEGHLEFEIIDFDLAELIKGATDLLNPIAMKKGLAISTKSNGDLPHCFKGDPERLRQVLINLIGNAIKFTEEGFITIRTDVAELQGNRALLSIYVVDTGIGVPDGKIEELFARFKTVAPTYQRKEGGAGLGLAICRQIIEAQGGTIGAKSNDLGGSTFWFNLELEISSSDNLVKKEDELPVTVPVKPDGKPYRLLMAEDNPTNAMVATAMLEKAGYRIDVVGNGREAVDAVEEFNYDLVLMDIGMPVMDGTAAAAEIRRISGPVSEIPIIALTAHAMRSEMMADLLVGMDDYAAKPIDKALLLRTIGKWLDGEHAKHPAPTDGDVDDTDPSTPTNVDTPNSGQPTPPPPSEMSDMPAKRGNSGRGNQIPLAKPLAEVQLLDPDVLVQLGVDTDPEMLPVLIDDFITNSRDRYNSIAAASNSEDLSDLEHHAHALCSSAATFGALKLRQLVVALEAACQQGDKRCALDLAHDVEDIGQQTESAMRNYVNNP